MSAGTETGIICPVCKKGLLTMVSERVGTTRMTRVTGVCGCGASVDGGLVRIGTEPIDGEARIAAEAVNPRRRRI